MMTTERHTRFDLSDLVAVVLCCPKCNISVSYPINTFGKRNGDRTPNLVEHCPQCGHQWGLKDNYDPATVRLLKAIGGYLDDVDPANPHVHVKFDLPEKD